MRFKVDENLHPDVAGELRRLGHDAMTVFDQGMQGSADENVAAVCQREARALVTLDLDFADVRAYPPQDYPGIVVLRPTNQNRAMMLQFVSRFVPLLSTAPLVGHLWIVDDSRVRIRGTAPPGSP